MAKPPMTTDEKIKCLVAFQDKQTMRNYRMLARTEALEVVLRGMIPEPKLKQWDVSLERETQIALQRILTECERFSPGYAAKIDDREPWELKLID
jgi:hypothetical protein